MNNAARRENLNLTGDRNLDDKPTLRVACATRFVVRDLHKSYRRGNVPVPVLKGIDLEIREGEFTCIVGQSGSGKSTLLHLLGTLDVPDRGEIHLDGQRIDNMPTRQKERLRNREFGMIFQFYHLLPELTMLENVLIPRMIQDGVFQYMRKRSAYRRRAMEMLELVGLQDRIHHRPSQMSGGEMQRTAIARALVSEPSVLLADEPTGNLDRKNGQEVMQTLLRLQREQSLTIVMVTHDESIADSADQLIRLVDGRVA